MRRKTWIAAALAGAVITTLTVAGADATGRDDGVARAFTAASLATPWQQVARSRRSSSAVRCFSSAAAKLSSAAAT